MVGEGVVLGSVGFSCFFDEVDGDFAEFSSFFFAPADGGQEERGCPVAGVGAVHRSDSFEVPDLVVYEDFQLGSWWVCGQHEHCVVELH